MTISPLLVYVVGGSLVLAVLLAYALTRRRPQSDMAERIAIARAFNDRYTYRKQYVDGMAQLPGSAMYGLNPRGGNAWMCPDCNRIHHPKSCSVFSGLQYPACCTTPEGHRLDRGIRVT